MTDQSFEYKTLRFLDHRIERYDITDHSLKIFLYDFTVNDYNQGMDTLRKAGFVKNKDLYDKGLTITREGQNRLTQLQKDVDREKKESKSWWERISPIRDAIGTVGIIAGIYVGSETLANDNSNKILESEVKVLNDSISVYKNHNENLIDSISFFRFEMKRGNQKDSLATK